MSSLLILTMLYSAIGDKYMLLFKVNKYEFTLQIFFFFPNNIDLVNFVRPPFC